MTSVFSRFEIVLVWSSKRMCTKHRNFIPLIDYICLLPKSVERDITNDNAEMLYFVTARFSVCFITVI